MVVSTATTAAAIAGTGTAATTATDAPSILCSPL